MRNLHVQTMAAAFTLLLTIAAGDAAAIDRDKLLGAAMKAGQAATLSDTAVIASANDGCAHMDKESKLAPVTDKYAKRLATIAKGLEQEDGMQLNFKVYLTPEVNAWAMANGCVRVYSGLLDVASDDEVRGVIGHEIGHVKLGHSKAKQRTALLASAARDGVALNGKVGAYAQGQMGEIAESVLNAQFSQKEEIAADEYGYRFMIRHKYNPNALVTLFKKLPSTGGLTSSHPASETRARKVEALIKKGG